MLTFQHSHHLSWSRGQIVPTWIFPAMVHLYFPLQSWATYQSIWTSHVLYTNIWYFSSLFLNWGSGQLPCTYFRFVRTCRVFLQFSRSIGQVITNCLRPGNWQLKLSFNYSEVYGRSSPTALVLQTNSWNCHLLILKCSPGHYRLHVSCKLTVQNVVHLSWSAGQVITDCMSSANWQLKLSFTHPEVQGRSSPTAFNLSCKMKAQKVIHLSWSAG